MAITLETAKVGMADHVDQNVIDNFQRTSYLLNALTFDDSVSPGTGGSTMVYGYQMLKTPSTAGTRAINSEYAANEAVREEKTTNLRIMGGSFSIDRVIQMTSGTIDEMEFQLDDKVKAVSNEFHWQCINGNGTGQNVLGLNKLLEGTSNVVASSSVLTSSENIDAHYNTFLDELDKFLRRIQGGADAAFMNTDMYGVVVSCARRAGYYRRDTNAFGEVVEYFGKTQLVDLGSYWNGTAEVDVVGTKAATQTAYGTTDIYAVHFGLNAFHGASLAGGLPINTYLPDFKSPGAVKKGEVELIAAPVLKNSKAAGKLSGIAVTPKTTG